MASAPRASSEGTGETQYKPAHGPEVAFDDLKPGKEYVVKTNDIRAWFKGTFDKVNSRGAAFKGVRMFGRTSASVADVTGGPEGSDVYPGSPESRTFTKGSYTFYESAGPGYTTNGGKRYRKKATRKGSRKSRRTTRRKRFT
jgi:hypothetical protein